MQPKLNAVLLGSIALLLAVIAFILMWIAIQQTKNQSTQLKYSGHVDEGFFIILNNNTGEAKVILAPQHLNKKVPY